MKKAFLPLMGSILVIAILFSGTVYRENYVAPWDAASNANGGSPLTGESIRSTIEGLLLPAAKGILRLSANAADVEGTGELVENAGGDVGDTGANIAFQNELYPYRAMLSQKQQAVYNQAYANATAVNTESFMLVETMTEAELIDVMSALLNDQPQLFYLETRYSYGYLIDGSVVSLKLSFNDTANDLPASKAAFESAAYRILSEAVKLGSPVEQEQYVHDQLLENAVYDTESKNNQSAYSALVSGSSVCAGYSRALQYLLIQLGIPCYYCEGTVDGGNHAWNIVSLSGGYYNVDPSWNDVTYDGSVGHSYFNVTDADISRDHLRRGLSLNLPDCTAERYTRNAIYGEEEAPQSVPSQGGAPTFESLGFSGDDIIRWLSAYYGYCEKELTRLGTGTHTMEMIIKNIELVNEIYAGTKNKDYLDGYAEQVAENLNLSNCSFSLKLSAEYLADGFILLDQEVTIEGGGKAERVTPTPRPTEEPTPEPVVITPEPTPEPLIGGVPGDMEGDSVGSDAFGEGAAIEEGGFAFATAEPGAPEENGRRHGGGHVEEPAGEEF